MVHVDSLIPSKYLKAADLQGRGHKVVISHIQTEEVGAEKKSMSVAYFVGRVKGMTLNKTNLRKIASLHGDETDDWEGKVIEIFPTQAQFGDEEVDCIRIRAWAAKPAAPKPVAAPAIEPPPRDDMDDDIPF